MTRRNRTRFTILGTLTLGPRSGYDIKRFIERSLGTFWRESFGQLYPTLRQLETEGLVVRQTEDRRGRRARHVYAITPAGQAALEAWLGEPAVSHPPRVEVLLKLFFGTEAPPGANIEHIRRFRAEVERGGTVCGEMRRALSSGQPTHPNLPYWLLGLRQGAMVCAALLQWCDEAERVIRRIETDDL